MAPHLLMLGKCKAKQHQDTFLEHHYSKVSNPETTITGLADRKKIFCWWENDLKQMPCETANKMENTQKVAVTTPVKPLPGTIASHMDSSSQPNSLLLSLGKCGKMAQVLESLYPPADLEEVLGSQRQLGSALAIAAIWEDGISVSLSASLPLFFLPFLSFSLFFCVILPSK